MFSGIALKFKHKKTNDIKQKEAKQYRFFFHAFLIVSISLICLLGYHTIKIEYSNMTESYEIFLELLKEIGIALFLLGSISVLLEVDEFSKFFVEKLRSVVLLDECLEKIEPKEQSRLLEKLNQELYYNEIKPN